MIPERNGRFSRHFSEFSDLPWHEYFSLERIAANHLLWFIHHFGNQIRICKSCGLFFVDKRHKYCGNSCREKSRHKEKREDQVWRRREQTGLVLERYGIESLMGELDLDADTEPDPIARRLINRAKRNCPAVKELLSDVFAPRR